MNSNSNQLVVIEYMCTWCGRTEKKNVKMGRPMPGKCPKRSIPGKDRPHVWVVNRRFYGN